MRFVLMAFLVLFLTSSTSAQSYGPPAFSEGDQWIYTDRTVTVVKVESDTVVFRGLNANCQKCMYYTDKNLVLTKVTDENGATPDSATLGFMPVGPDWRFWSWPLEVNRNWRFSVQALAQRSVQNYVVNATVEAYEDVKTKAGTLKAFRVRREWSVREQMTGYEYAWSLIWFSPDVRAQVKFTSRRQGAKEFELVSYTLK